MALTKRSTPGVYLTEVDESNSLQPVGTSTGAIAIRSTKGVINKPVLVTSEKDLVNQFGKPVFTSGVDSNVSTLQSSTREGIPDTGYGFYAAQQFLQESRNLYVARIADENDKYSALYFKTGSYDYTSSATNPTSTSAIGIASVPFVNGNQFDRGDYISSIELSAGLGEVGGASDFLIGSLSPGAEGDNVAVSIESYSSACDWMYKYDGFPLSGTPSEETQVIAAKVVRVDVYTKESTQSWDAIRNSIATKQVTAATSASSLRKLYPPVETFYGTLVSQLDANNRQLKLNTVVNGNSQYIYVKIGAGASFSYLGSSLALTDTPAGFMKAYDLLNLGGGAVDVKSGLGDDATDNATNYWDIFASRTKLPNLNILICPDWNMALKQKVATIASVRQDCIAVLQSGDPESITPAAIMADESYGYPNPSYVALYDGYDKIYDQYNNKFFYAPKAIFGAMIMARTDRVGYTWMPPAGTNRGIIPSFGQLFTLEEDEIGQLYDRNINSSMTQVGVGAYLMGQKTAQMKASALDRINVRRCLLFIENTIRPLLTPFLFELNTASTRSRVQNIIDNFLADVLASGGVTAYSVTCDDSNNTAQVIDANVLAVGVNVQPSRSIEFIELKVTVQSTGVSVTEA